MQKQVVLFDGVCNLCNHSVQFIIKHDHQNKFKFASLQSEFGQQLLKDQGMDQNNFNSFLYLRGQDLKKKSDAALFLLYDLKNMWQLLFVFILVPKIIRDFVYSFIAKYRYAVFGKKNTCMIPEKKYLNKFIE